MTRFYIGLDLGQQQDYSSVALVEYVPQATTRREMVRTYRPDVPGTLVRYETVVDEAPPLYQLRDLWRFPLGTRYTRIVSAKVDPLSSTMTQPVFSVGTSCHPYKTLDTGPRARPGPPCPARAAKFGSYPYRRPALPVIEIDRSAILERLMRSLRVVELEILTNPVAGLARAAIIGEIHLLVLERAP